MADFRAAAYKRQEALATALRSTYPAKDGACRAVSEEVVHAVLHVLRSPEYAGTPGAEDCVRVFTVAHDALYGIWTAADLVEDFEVK